MKQFPNLAVEITFLLLVTTLVSCGTLDIKMDQTPDATLPATTAVSDVTTGDATVSVTTVSETQDPEAGWGSLVSYIHPMYGYELPIPAGADIHELDEDDRTTGFRGQAGDNQNPSYMITVQVLPAEGRSAAELAAELATGENEASDVESLALVDETEPGALFTYSVGAGFECPEVRPLLAVIVNDDISYVIRIFSDRPGHCDVIEIPEALTIVKGFRPHATAPILAMTPTPTPALIDDLVVVFTRDNNAWLWTENGGELQLTKDGGVDQVLLSTDKSNVAFRRGNGVWAVNADGSNERQLVRESDLPLSETGELAGSITGMTINQLAWIPDSHQLLFNTRLQFNAPGLLLSDDLWRVDADTLSLESLFAPGNGGNFTIAPDGNQVALTTPESISLTTINGEERQQLFSYTPVLTYSEFRYYAEPVWSPGSDVLAVVIPPPDRLASENQAFGLWRLHTDGTPAVLAGTIETVGGRPMPEPVINPTLDMIAYLSSPEAAPERTDLLFVSWADTIGDPTFYTGSVDSFDAWSPGGERFSFNRPPSEIASISAFTGRLNEEPKPVGDEESAAINVRWIDDDRYLYLQASDKGWNLILADDSGVVTPVAGVVGQPPAFDVMQ